MFCFVFILAGYAGFSQKTYKGSAIDAHTSIAVEGVTIHNQQTKETVISNENGVFIFQKAVSPTDTLTASAIDFETQKLTLLELQQNNGIFFLKRGNIQLTEVVVSAIPNIHNKIISKIDIKLRDINNAQEVLRIVPGLFIGQHAGGGKAEQIFLRGFDIDHGTDIAISVDGMAVNMVSHAHGQGYADLHFLIPELIERVDFRKGTYYPEKGNFTTAGYVDFKTADVLSNSSIKEEGGMYNTWRTVGLFDLLSNTAKEKGQSLYFGSEYLYSKGYFEHPQDFNRINLFTKYHGRLNEQNILSLSGSYFKSDWNASGQIPDRAVESGAIGFFGAIDPYEGGVTGRSNGNIQLTTTLPNNSTIKNQLYFTDYDFELYSNFTFFKNDAVNGDQIKQKEKRTLYGYNGSYTVMGFVGNTPLTTEVGAQVRLDKTKDSELSRTIDRTTIAERIMLGNITEANLGAYINETLRLRQNFTLGAGVRYDYFINQYKDVLNNNGVGKTSAGIVSPKLNLQYNLNNRTQFYLAAGKGFHSNDTRVAVPQNGLHVLPAAYGADLGATVKPAKNLLVTTALWYLWLEQEFVYVGDEGIVEPSGKSRRVGIDVSARYQPLKWLFADVDFNVAKPRSIGSPKGEDYLPLAPQVTSAGGVTVKTSSGINGSLRYRYMGDRPANEDYSLTAKGYFVTDVVLNYAAPKFEVGLNIQNLFNVKWKETQFETESRLFNEPQPVSEIHFTPGTPFFLKASFTYSF